MAIKYNLGQNKQKKNQRCNILTESKHKYQTIIFIFKKKKGLNIQAGQRPCKDTTFKIALDPDDKSLPLWASKQSRNDGEKLSQTLSSVCMILLRKTSLHSTAKQQQQSYTSPCQHTAVQQSETQDWPESSTEGIKWLRQLLNTAMLAPSHWQISTTVYLHAQFVASFSANTGFKEGLALHNSKVKKWKVLFSVYFFLSWKGLKRQQHSAPCRNHRRRRRRMHCNRV